MSTSNLVYALVRNETTVVTVDSRLADACRAGVSELRDTRAFPVAADDAIRSLSLSLGTLIYVLTQDAKGVWRLEAPVRAPADAARVAALVDKVMRVKEGELVSEEEQRIPAVRVTVTTASTTWPDKLLPLEFFGKEEDFADLRSRTLLALDVASVRRLALVSGTDRTVVARDAARGTWKLQREEGSRPTARRVLEAGVMRLLSSLARLEALNVVRVAATPEDFERCGLAVPAQTVEVDVDAADAIRWNVLLGGEAPNGGRYATLGGSDVIFILSRQTVADLTAALAE